MPLRNLCKLKVYSPNYSCAPLRTILLSKRVVLRLGSSKPHPISDNTIQLNSPIGVQISSDKRRSKQYMDIAHVKHAEWLVSDNESRIREFFNTYGTIIIKKYNSCKGNNIYYIDSREVLDTWLSEHSTELNKFVCEKYYFYKREYRFHVSKEHGIFYSCRKLLRNDAADTWHRHDSNSVWILPTNPKFKTPSFLNEIEEDCKRYMEVTGLDICAFDVKSDDNSYIILESNTSPSLGEVGLNVYKNYFYKYYGN